MRETFLALVVAAGAVSSAGAVEQQQFDLACIRMKTTTVPYPTERYRIDLNNRTWCAAADCVQRPLAITDEELSLEWPNWSKEPGAFATRTVNRITGSYTFVFNMGAGYNVTRTTTGQCSLKPFSGPGAKKLF